MRWIVGLGGSVGLFGLAMSGLQIIGEILGSRFFGCELTGAKLAFDSELSRQVDLRFYDKTVA